MTGLLYDVSVTDPLTFAAVGVLLAGVAILAAGDVEGMEMAAVPAHRRLDRLMQVAQRHLTGNEKTTPDRGLRPG